MNPLVCELAPLQHGADVDAGLGEGGCVCNTSTTAGRRRGGSVGERVGGAEVGWFEGKAWGGKAWGLAATVAGCHAGAAIDGVSYEIHVDPKTGEIVTIEVDD